MSTALANPYASRPTAARNWEKFFFWVFRLATYFILACGLLVFGNIVLKGSRTVFRASPPFINVPFLTQAPETLYVLEPDGKKMEMGDHDYRTFREAEEAKAKFAGKPAPVFKAESIAYS